MDAFDLPIRTALPGLREALAGDGASAVLHAPPGAGKSTVVPLAVLEEPWARGKRIVMLEPRRLAARAVARRMATTLGERVGERVGYRMRLDTLVSKATRIEVVTEGVLTRMLQSDPSLEGVALVIFDEFHERSLQADLGLALTLDAREALAPELRILVMSATLAVEPVTRLLGDATIVRSEGRAFPVETRYAGRGLPALPQSARGGVSLSGAGRRDGPVTAEQAIARIVRLALDDSEGDSSEGDVLVFLPGAAEIRRVQRLLGPLESSQREPRVQVVPLYGDLGAKEQDTALAPSPAGWRKVILSTNIAETSLTIEGVRVVVDSGLVRRAVFDPGTGMSRLQTERISRASAEQRRGRAGRTAPGLCYRAWSEAADRSLAPTTPPEIASADLAPLVLELANWGANEPASMRWIDPPPHAAFESARDLLRRLGALDAAGRITPHGRAMSSLPLHPRLAHMLIESRGLAATRVAAQLAALLSDRSILRTGGGADSDADIRSHLALLSGPDGHAAEFGDRAALRRARRFAEALERRGGDARRRPSEAPGPGSDELRRGRDVPGRGKNVPRRGDDVPGRGARSRHQRGHGSDELERRDNALERRGYPENASVSDDIAGLLLAFAYPDRIGRRRPGDAPRYTLANGRGAVLSGAPLLAREEFIVALDVDDRDRDAHIRLAAPLARDDLETHFAAHLEHIETVEWSSREQAVLARRIVRFEKLVIDDAPLPQVPAERAATAMLEGVRELGLDALPWNDATRGFQARVEFVRSLDLPDTADWPALDDASLAAELDAWLTPWLGGITRREHLARLPLAEALAARLGWERQARLDELAPARLEVPSGSRIEIDYRSDHAPLVAVRLQEVFGLEDTPRIGGNRVPVTFALLSPARRPVQVTRDLASFWRNAYRDVRKDLRGRYPKHYWPENPLEAEPTRGVKKRR